MPATAHASPSRTVSGAALPSFLPAVPPLGFNRCKRIHLFSCLLLLLNQVRLQTTNWERQQPERKGANPVISVHAYGRAVPGPLDLLHSPEQHLYESLWVVEKSCSPCASMACCSGLQLFAFSALLGR